MSIRRASKQNVNASFSMTNPGIGGLTVPTISSVIYTDSSYVALDDTAIALTGGYVRILGTGFGPSFSLFLNGTQVTSINTTYVSSTEIRALLPGASLGTYSLMLFNANNAGVYSPNSVFYSPFPTYGVPIAVAVLNNVPFSQQLGASGDAPLAYSIISGSLPTGVTLSSTGLLSGTPTGYTSNQTFNFTIQVNDAQLQTITQAITLTIQVGDQYWNYTSLLLNADTSPLATTFINDASLNNNQITINGDAKPTLFNPYSDGYYSYLFGGSNDLSMTAANTIGMTTTSGAFTYELWLFLNAQPTTYYIFDGRKSSGTGALMYVDAGNLGIAFGGTGSTGLATVANPLVIGRWYHLAIVRSGTGTNQTVLYLNGSAIITTTWSTSTTVYHNITLGNYNATGYPLSGYISNFRFVNGTAVYTGGFTPPTAPLTAIANTQLLTCQSNSVVDRSPGSLALSGSGTTAVSAAHPFAQPSSVTVNNGYSVYFNGSTDYLTVNGTTAFNLVSATTFTIEAWIFPTVAGTSRSIISKDWSPGNTYASFLFAINSSNQLNYGGGSGTSSSGGSFNFTSTATISTNVWTHVALCGSTTTYTLFINGVQDSTGSMGAGSIGLSSNNMVIGGSNSGALGIAYFAGYISNLRLVKGLQVYTGTPFTVPTGPLTVTQSSGTNIAAITGTSTNLLTCQGNQLIDASSNAYTFAPSGSLKIVNNTYPFTQTTTTISSLTTLGSMYLDGNGDYLTLPSGNPSLQLTSSDFTLEAWVYPTSFVANGNPVFALDVNGSYYASIRFGYESAGAISILMSTSGTAWALNVSSGIGTMVLNTWQHLALSRSGTSVRVFLNGIQQGSTQTVSGALMTSTNNWIGYLNAPSAQYVNGYICDARITKTALYTGNFAPTNQPLTTITNTQLLTCQYNGGGNNYGVYDNSSFSNIITRAGNAAQGTFSPYSPNGWSNYFNGSSYLNMGTNAAFAIGTADFTIEAWVYPTAANQAYSSIFVGASFGSSSDWGLYCGNGTTALYPMFQFTNSVSDRVSSSTALVIGTWNHIAVTRQSGAAKIFVNGAVTGSGTFSTQSLANSLSKGIGAAFDGNGSTTFTGYISNLRIVSGTAVYTAAFTPPTSPLPVVAGTILLTCQSNRFVENGPLGISTTIGGTPLVQAFSPFNGTSVTPNTYSNYFNGSTDYLQGSTYSPSLTPGTNNFTIEFWVFPTVTSGRQDWFDLSASAGNNRILIYYTGTAVNYDAGDASAATSRISYTVALSTLANAWHHIALVRNAGSSKLFLDGTQVGSTYTDALNWTAAFRPTIGKDPFGTTYITGYVSNLRFINGLAVYTANFTVPTTQLAITQSSGTNIAAISGIPTNGNSVYFDGSTSYLAVPDNAGWAFAADFTMEAWVYPTAIGTNNNIITQWGATGNSNFIFRYISTSNRLQLVTNGSVTTTGSTTAVTQGVWNHLAVSRQGTTIRFFVNGTVDATTATLSGALLDSASSIFIGALNDGSGVPTGFMSNVRVVNGTALYTANFTTSTTPLTAVAGTLLLTCQSTTFIDNSSNGFSITLNGTPLISRTLSPFGYTPSLLTCQSNTIVDNSNNKLAITASGNPLVKTLNPLGQTTSTGITYSPSTHGGSVYFDGTGDYLEIAHNPNQWISNLDFTIELWFYTPYSGSGGQTLVTKQWQGTQAYGSYVLYIETTNQLRFLGSSSGGAWEFDSGTGSTTLKPNQWYHVAATRSGTAFKIFLNGVVDKSATTSTSFFNQTDSLRIGCAGPQTGNGPYFQGYMSDVRIIKGIALYTSNFYPTISPITPLVTSGSNTYSSLLLLNATSSGIMDQHASNVLESVSNAQLISEDPYSGSYYSNLFNGTVDYITVSATSGPLTPLMSANAVMTIEAWVYATTLRASGVSTYTHPSILGLGNTYFNLGVNNGTPRFYWWTGAQNYIDSTITITTGTWNHIALVFTGTNVNLYVNGSLGISFAFTYISGGSAATLYIGQEASNPATSLWPGYISNLRIVNGTALYTNTFTPSTTALTAVSGTTLLTCQSNKIVDNSSSPYSLAVTGTPSVKSRNPFRQNTGKSIWFNGTTQYLTMASQSLHIIGQTSATIELWIYPTTVAGYQRVVTATIGGFAAGAFCMRFNNGTFLAGDSGGNVVTTSGMPLTANQWNHIAWVGVSGTTQTLYVNGVSAGTSTTYNLTTAIQWIGGYYTTGPAEYTSGYIKDLRITKGYARYTATFTPPTTQLLTR